jgi:DNA-binding transcriptional ArsR family regulator
MEIGPSGENDSRAQQQFGYGSTQMPTNDAAESGRLGESPSGAANLDRSFVSDYLDELIIAILLRCGEANGMDLIREFTHCFGVQFSPGTVYPHLHSLEEQGILARRERVQTKEYRIDDELAAREYLDSTETQLVCLGEFLRPIIQEGGQPDETSD